MTSKSKGKYHQLNINSIQNSKLKDPNTKIKTNFIDNIFQSSNTNPKSNKIIGNVCINLNLNKNNNQNNYNTNNLSNVINMNNNNLLNKNNPSNINSGSFRQEGLFAKKYKTSKNSPDKILANFNERNFSGEKAGQFTSTFVNSSSASHNKDISKQTSGSIYNNTSTNLNTNTNTHINTNSNNNSNSTQSNINLNSNNNVYNVNIDNNINKNININIHAGNINTINNPINSIINNSEIKIGSLSNHFIDSNFNYDSKNQQSSNCSKNKNKSNTSQNLHNGSMNHSNYIYDKMENIQINDTSFNKNLNNTNQINLNNYNYNNNNNNENVFSGNNNNISMAKMLQFKKEYLNVKNINKDEAEAQTQSDLIIKQKLQKKKTEQQKNKSNFLNFTNPINPHNGTLNQNSCKNTNNNNSVNANFENKHFFNMEDSKQFELNNNFSQANHPQSSIASNVNLANSTLKELKNALYLKGINSNTNQYNLNTKLDTNSQEKKSIKDHSGIISSCETEIQLKKYKENQNLIQSNYMNNKLNANTNNNNNFTKTLNSNIQTTSTIQDLTNLNLNNKTKLNIINNNIINTNQIHSTNNSSNKINKTGNSQIKNLSNTNSNMNIGSVNLKLNQNNNFNSNSNLNYNTDNRGNIKENFIKSNKNTASNQPLLNQNNYHSNVNINLAKSIIGNNVATNIKELGSTNKKNNLQNSKIIKSNYNYNSTPKTDLIKTTKVDKYENKIGKVERIEKPNSSKLSKDKKETSNYNKIIIFSNNYNPKSLKDRVFLTKQPTNKNSRKTSNEKKNAEKIIAFYTNNLQTNSKQFVKNSGASNNNVDKNAIFNISNQLNEINRVNCVYNTSHKKNENYNNGNSVLESHNLLLNSNNNNFQKMHSSAQSSIEKTKPFEYLKNKNFVNQKIDLSLVNTEENNFDKIEKENRSSMDEKIIKYIEEEKYNTKYSVYKNHEQINHLKNASLKYKNYEPNDTDCSHSIIDKNHEISDLSIIPQKKNSSNEILNKKIDSIKTLKKSNDNIININSNKNAQSNLRYLQIDKNILNSSLENKGILKEKIKSTSISDASFKASLISQCQSNQLNIKGSNLNNNSISNNNNLMINIETNDNRTLNPSGEKSKLDKLKKNCIAISVPITTKQSKNNSKSTSRVDDKSENKRSKLIESEIKRFQMNLSQLYKDNKKKFSSGNSPLHEQILFKKDFPITQNNFKIGIKANTGANTNHVNSVNQSHSKNFEGENSHSNINLGKIKMDNPFKLNLSNLKSNINNNSKYTCKNTDKTFKNTDNYGNNKKIKENAMQETNNNNNNNIASKKNHILKNALNNTNYHNTFTDEKSFDNFYENSQISEHSTFRESNYYKKESEKIANMIRECYQRTNEYPKTNLRLYKFGRLIGRGAFGKVNIGLHILSGRIVAIKSFNKTSLEISVRKIMYETNLMKNLYDRSIVRIYETFETQKYILIVMEFICGGDLLNFVKKRTKLNEPTAKLIFRQIIEGLQYIHSQNIVHRDIKLDNILIDLTNTVKICDFGVSRQIKKGEIMYDQCGTPAYIAPEIILGKGYEGFGVDIWSSGVVLYAMLAGVVPFRKKNLEEMHQSIIEGEYKELENTSVEAKDLIKGILNTDPLKRLTIEEILNHEWLKFDFLDENIKNKNKLILFTNAEKILLSKTNIDYRVANKDDIMENFTLKNLDSNQEIQNQNVNTKSQILAPFNSTLKKNENWKLAADLMIENDLMKFCGKAKEAYRNYELNNNGEIDNGYLIPNITDANSIPKQFSKANSAISSKASINSFNNDAFNKIKIGSSKNSNTNSNANLNALNMKLNASLEDENNNPNSNNYLQNNLCKKFTNSREYLLLNNNNIVIDENIISQMENFGYTKEYILKSLNKRELNYATTAYNLLLNSENEI